MAVRAVLEHDPTQTASLPTDETPTDAAAMTGEDLFALGDIGRTERVSGDALPSFSVAVAKLFE
jgi:hypothetical protein